MKALRLKDRLLSFYAVYSYCSMIQMESSETFKEVLGLSDELNHKKNYENRRNKN